ncbi:MAG: 4Fe-4S dicluster domain-containing protein [Candidatus Thorarchaeota archaeon]
MGIDEYRHIVMECVSCGLCQSNCPIYKQTTLEANSAKGKMTLLYAVFQGWLEWQDITDRLYECTTCKNCQTTCLSGLDISAVVEAARAELVERGIGDPVARQIVENIRRTHNPFGEGHEPRRRLKEFAEA